MLVGLVIVLLLIAGAEGFLLYRASRRLLQFDQIFENVVPVLENYGSELKRTLSAGLLEDHPEVTAFHKLNLRAMAQIEAITEMVTMTRPPKPPRLPKNARPPVVE